MNTKQESPSSELRKANEEFYFQKRNAELVDKIRDDATLRELGISDERLIDNLRSAGFNNKSIQALFFVPFVEAAWADDEIDQEERDEILNTLEKRGVSKDSEAFKIVERWLAARPTDEMFLKATRLVGPVMDELKKSGLGNIMWILEGTRRVANATGDVFSRLGMGGNLSSGEEEVIMKIEKRIQDHNTTLGGI
jgi:hypothetical protein